MQKEFLNVNGERIGNKYRIPYIADSSNSLYTNIKHLEYKVEKLRKGNVLCADSLQQVVFFLIKGRLKVCLSNNAGAERMLFYLTEHSFGFPYLPELADAFDARFIADEDCELAYFRENDFKKNTVAYSDMIISIIQKRMVILAANMLAMQSETGRNRVYQLIYQMALNNKNTSDGPDIAIISFLPNKDISLFTGVHRSNVFKYITELEDRGIIEKTKHKLLVKDIKKLEQLIKHEYQDM